MDNKIKILHLEDSLLDSELIQSLLANGEFNFQYFLADNEHDFLNILESESIHIILSDYSLPDYNGRDALKVVRKKHAGIPFIFVSGAMGEDAAIEAMINGATDYVLKNKMDRLVPAIKRALHEHDLELNHHKYELNLVRKNKKIKAQNETYIQINKELILAKEHAEKSDQLKTAFLQNMSHEIRTPLNGILGFSDLLNDEDISKEEIEKYTAIINQNGKRLMDIVNNVLDISKIQTGQIHITQKTIHINKIFADLLNFFSPFAISKNIILRYNTRDDLGSTIYSDETKLYQILTNLINNALKYSTSGLVEYGFLAKGYGIQFYVRDTGIGIDPDLHGKIFERFMQPKQSRSGVQEGAGLGLAICKGLVELLGGRIWVESEVDKGSTFYFTLPSTTFTETAQEEKVTKQTGIPHYTHGKILIAEDDWVNFEYLRKLLVKAGITVIHAENGSEAVNLVRINTDIDLILMDIRMPVMDGVEAARIIKQLRPALPIVAHTANNLEEEPANTEAYGCDEYLAKPFKPQLLHSIINKYLN